MGYMFPLPKGTPRSQQFGTNPGGYNPAGGHTGQDYACPIGTPVRAPGDGVISFEGWTSNLPADYRQDGSGPNPYWFAPGFGGITVSLDCGPVVFHVAHMNQSVVDNGQHVRKGDIIGYSGNTGTATSGPHAHFEAMPNGWDFNNGTYGRVNPDLYCDHYWEDSLQPASGTTPTRPLAANERMAGGSPVNQRAEPKLHAAVVRTIPALSREAWEGWVHGEEVDLGGGVRSDIWLKDAQGYASVLFFDPTNVDGMTDLNPKTQALGERERVSGPYVVNQRSAPALNAPVVRQIPANSKEIWEGYVHGELVDLGGGTRSDIWYKDSIGYASMLFFDPTSTGGLPNLTPPPAPAPTPAPTPAPAEPTPETPTTGYTFSPAVDVVTEVIPAAEGKFLRGNMPATVTGLVVHQFIADSTRFDVHLGSVINTFTGGDRVASAHFGIEGKRVVQFVDLSDRAYHAGVRGNDHWSVEVYGGMDAETLATLARLIHQLETKFGRKLTLYRHKELMATACGTDVDLTAIRSSVTVLDPVIVIPEPKPPVLPTDEKAVIMAFLEHLADRYLAGK